MWVAAAIAALSVFPVYVTNYVYADSEEKYVSVNICLFRYIGVFNANTVKDNPMSMQINGKSRNIDVGIIRANIPGIISRIHINKIVQLGDYGIKNDGGAYAAVVQSVASDFIYKLLQINGSHAKLRNYAVLNECTAGVRYYAKIVTVINAVTICNIIFYLITEKLK